MTQTVEVADIEKTHKNAIAELVQTACKFESHIEIESKESYGDYGIWLEKGNGSKHFRKRNR